MTNEIAIQTCFLTDGSEVFAEATMTVPDELDKKNEQAKLASDGIFYWVRGSNTIAEMPKANTFRYINVI